MQEQDYTLRKQLQISKPLLVRCNIHYSIVACTPADASSRPNIGPTMSIV